MSRNVLDRPTSIPVVATAALVLVALLSLASFATLASRLSVRERDARVINVTGQQRTLAQRVALLAQQLSQEADQARRQSLRRELAEDVQRMEQAHAQLTDPASELYPPHTSETLVREVYFAQSGLDRQVRSFLEAAHVALRAPDAGLLGQSAPVQALLNAANGPLLPALDAAVSINQLRVEAGVRQMSTLAFVLLLLSLSLLAVIGFGVLLPLVRRWTRASQALERERNFARQVMENLGQGLAVAGADDRYEYVNPAFARMLGRSPEQVLGLRPQDLVPPDQRTWLAQDHERWLQGDTTTRDGLTFLTADGTPVLTLVTAVPQPGPGGLGVISVITDLSERLRAERALIERNALYRTLATHFPDGALLLFDHELRYSVAGGQGLAGVGLSKAAVEGRRLHELLPRALALRVEGDHRAALAGVRREREVRFGRRTYLTRTLPVKNENGAVFAGMLMVQDVTERKRAERQLAIAAAHSAALLEVSRLAQAELPPEDVALRCVEVVSRAADVEWGGLVVFEGDTARSITAWQTDKVTEGFRRIATLGLARGQSLLWEVIERAEPMYLNDYPAEQGAFTPFTEAGVRSVASIPLITEGEQRFLFSVVRIGTRRDWSEQERALFEAAARTVQLALERRAHVRELEHAALSDILTGLGNRRAFERDLAAALAGSASGHLGVMMLDLDGLKGVNDREGHERGDALLVCFAQTLRRHVRVGDQVYRLGGDEYAAILLQADPASQDGLERRVRLAVEDVRQAGFTGIDASAGFAFAPHEERSVGGLLRRADQRMYAQKQQRRAARNARQVPLGHN